MKKPDFFIVGAPKCGTTTLYHWLKLHPDIFMPEAKEPHYFAQNLSDRYCRIRTEEQYLSLFNASQRNVLCGEASVLYGFYPESIKNILKHNPNAKFIFMLRNPVDMAPSYHRQLINNLEEDVTSFENAWSLQKTRMSGNNLPITSTDPDLLQYGSKCALGNHLNTIVSAIPKSQLLVLFLDDLRDTPQKTYQETLSFLSTEDDGREDFKKENQAAAIQSRYIKKLLDSPPPWLKLIKKLIKITGIPIGTLIQSLNRKQIKPLPLPEHVKKQLADYFETDIQLIEKITGRDCKHWRKIS